MASFPSCLPTMASAAICVPLPMPGMDRRPRKTRVMASPLPSTSTHSSVGTSPQGCTRSVLTRPATRAWVRHCNSAMGVAPGRAENTVRSASGSGVVGVRAGWRRRGVVKGRRSSIPGATAKGTMVALTCDSWLTMSTMRSAVWSWRMRRHVRP